MMIKAKVIKEKCVLCGGCVAVCVSNTITLTDDDLEIEEETMHWLWSLHNLLPHGCYERITN